MPPQGIDRAFSPRVFLGTFTWGDAPGWYRSGLWPSFVALEIVALEIVALGLWRWD